MHTCLLPDNSFTLLLETFFWPNLLESQHTCLLVQWLSLGCTNASIGRDNCARFSANTSICPDTGVIICHDITIINTSVCLSGTTVVMISVSYVLIRVLVPIQLSACVLIPLLLLILVLVSVLILALVPIQLSVLVVIILSVLILVSVSAVILLPTQLSTLIVPLLVFALELRLNIILRYQQYTYAYDNFVIFVFVLE